MARAEPVCTCRPMFELPAQWPIKTHIVTTWIQTHKSVPICGEGGATHYTVEVV